MGIFSKKEKFYSIEEMKQMLTNPKYSGYTAIAVEEGNPYTKFRLVKKDIAAKQIGYINQGRRAFSERISNGGQYKEIKPQVNYINQPYNEATSNDYYR